MKTKHLISGLLLATLALTSCSSESNETVVPRASGSIGGDIAVNTTYAKGDYVLDGPLVVKNGATLTIEKGSVINAKVDGRLDYVLIEAGGKIIAEGTASEPIVFTAQSKTPGSWGGIVIFGNASIKTLKGVTSGVSEIPGQPSYGGSVDSDNSGTIKYVQVLYAGITTGVGSGEFNGFSFYAVGSGTVLENLVSAFGTDDGFEFYGGTVSAKNLISYNNTDDSFDWEGGWQGQANSNWFAYQTLKANYGMEIEANSVNNSFYPVINGITLNRSEGTKTESTPSVQYDAIQFKNGGNGYFDNVKIVGFKNIAEAPVKSSTAVRIQDDLTNTDQVNGNKIQLTNLNISSLIPSQIEGFGSVVVSFPVGKFTTSTSASGAAISGGAWAVVNGINTLENL